MNATLTRDDVLENPDVRRLALIRTRERALADGAGGPWIAKTTGGFRYFVCRTMRFDGTRGLTPAQVAGMKKYEAEHGAGTSKIRSPDPDFTDPAYDQVFVWWEEFRKGGKGHFLMSRWTGKSTLVSLWILWMLLRDPNVAMLLIAENETIGTSFIEKMIRPWMTGMDGGYLQEVFGGADGSLPAEDQWGKWGKTTEIMAPRRTTTRRDPTIRVMGFNQDFTGKHPDYVLFEDPVNLVTTSTRAAKTQVKKSWRAAEFLMPKGLMAAGTIWADDDLFMDSIRAEKKRRLKGQDPIINILRLPCRVARVVRRRNDDGVMVEREEYDETCPPRFRHLTNEKLRALKVGDDSSDDSAPSGTRLFASQMDLDPMPASAMLFTEPMFRPYRWKPEEVYLDERHPEKGLKPHFTVCGFSDLAGSSGDSKDRSAHLVVAVDPRRHFFIIEACAGRFMPDANLRIMSAWYRRYQCLYWGVEGGVLRTVYEPMVRDWNQRFPTQSFSIRKVESGGARGSSNDRALRIRNYAERHEIHLGPSQSELLEELLRYSGIDNTRDDYVAALAIAVRNVIPGEVQPEDEAPKSYQSEMFEEMDRRAIAKAEDAMAGNFVQDVYGG